MSSRVMGSLRLEILLLFLSFFAPFTLSLTLPSLYAPVKASCPSSPLVRAASGVSSGESAYVNSRKPIATAALTQWLQKLNAGFPTSNLPTIGLTTSGGGLRSLLVGAGVVQGLDARDSNVGTSGLFQSLTYQAGLSGGAWFLSSLAGNNWPTVTSLKTSLWETAFQDTLLDPSQLFAAAAYEVVTNDIKAKNDAGFPPTLTDPWGRLLSYQLLNGFDGGVTDRLSGVTGQSNFSGHAVGYPIITSIGVQEESGQCKPAANGTQYELGPYEFGSWQSGVNAFTQTAYLGSSLSNGNPTTSGACIQNYDNLGYVLGTSSNLFNEACVVTPAVKSSSVLAEALAYLVNKVHSLTFRDEFAVYPNPFYQRPQSPLVSSQKSLYLVDGGETGQNNPIWPFLQSARSVDVLIVNDNSADTSDNFPNGTEIQETYLQAQAQGLSTMPFIPSVDVFVSQGLNKRPVFFGCDTTASTLFIVYVPNSQYSFDSGEPTLKLQYSKSDTDAMIANGVQIITKGGDTSWPTCLACGLLKKSGGSLPAACTQCFATYCYTQS